MLKNIRSSCLSYIAGLIMLLGSPCLCAQVTAPSEWQGTLDVNGQKLRLALHVTTSADGQLTATIDSLDQDAAAIPVNHIEVHKSHVEFTVTQVKASFSGKLSKNGGEMQGTWQEGRPLPLVLHLVTDPSQHIPPPRPIGGDWRGTLTDADGELHVRLHIDSYTATRIKATIVVAGQEQHLIEATEVTFDHDRLKFSVPAWEQIFEGTLSQDGSKIEGNWAGTESSSTTWTRVP